MGASRALVQLIGDGAARITQGQAGLARRSAMPGPPSAHQRRSWTANHGPSGRASVRRPGAGAVSVPVPQAVVAASACPAQRGIGSPARPARSRLWRLASRRPTGRGQALRQQVTFPSMRPRRSAAPTRMADGRGCWLSCGIPQLLPPRPGAFATADTAPDSGAAPGCARAALQRQAGALVSTAKLRSPLVAR